MGKLVVDMLNKANADNKALRAEVRKLKKALRELDKYASEFFEHVKNDTNILSYYGYDRYKGFLNARTEARRALAKRRK